jgi:hypothetical protein
LIFLTYIKFKLGFLIKNIHFSAWGWINNPTHPTHHHRHTATPLIPASTNHTGRFIQQLYTRGDTVNFKKWGMV